MTHPQDVRRLGLWGLIATTFFLVAGGPYGLEEVVASVGVNKAIVVLLVTPVVWSLPTALMIGELASALPEEGGYYVWVKRALGPFWGFQEAWWSRAASIFDMAIYPTLFVTYLAKVSPEVAHHPAITGTLLISVATTMNLFGIRTVGKASLLFGLLLVVPFLVFTFASPAGISSPSSKASTVPLAAGLMIAMWNYMGWDNASTFAAEVDRPARSYPLGMMLALLLVAITYVLPVWAIGRHGLDPSGWTTGSWVDAADQVSGPWLARAVVWGGALSAAGMFTALLLSYSRVPFVLAREGVFPHWFSKTNARGIPVRAVGGLAIAYALSLGLGFRRLVQLDVVLYGLGLALEFVALLLLRIKEPQLPRPFRIPGGLGFAFFIGAVPVLLIAAATYASFSEGDDRAFSLVVAGCVLVTGPLGYVFFRRIADVRKELALPK